MAPITIRATVSSALRSLVAFLTTLYKGYGDLGELGPVALLKKAISRGCSAWRGREKRRLDLYDATDSADLQKVGFVFPDLEWELESPQPQESLQQCADEFLCWGANKSGESVLVRLVRHPDGAIEAVLRVADASGHTMLLPKTVFADGSRQEAHRFSAGRLHATCLRPMRKWRLTYNGRLRVETADGGGELLHVDLRMFINSVTDVFDHYNDVSAEAHALLASKEPWSQLVTEAPRYDCYEQPVHLRGLLTTSGSTGVGSAAATSNREIHLWGVRYRLRERRSNLPATGTHHFIGTLENRTTFHVSTERVNSTEIQRGFVMAPNLYLHAVNTWNDVQTPGRRLRVQTGNQIHEFHAKHLTGHGTEVPEDGSVDVLERLSLTTSQSRGYGIHLVLNRTKPLKWKPPPVVRAPQAGKAGKSLVVCLEDADAWDTSLCGGKGSSLASLAAVAKVSREKFSVPGAVVLTTRAYAEFCKHNGLHQAFRDLRDYPRLTSDERKSLCTRLCEAVEKALVPENVVTELEEKLRRTHGERYRGLRFAVRSSAVGEDSEEMSCAGQMETFLNVPGVDEVLRCAVKCWASQFRHTALEYKWQHGQVLDAPMAVVVQEMAASDVSGVLFTCDPVSGDPGRLVVNANFGLGESVVSSLAEPDSITLERSEDRELRVFDTHLGRKQVRVLPTDNGTMTLNVTDEANLCLSEEDALLLGRTALEVQRLQPGTPDLDLEWAIAGGKLHLLQARPITSLFRETEFEIEHELDNGLPSEDEFYTRANLAEVLPGAISPLGGEVFMRSLGVLMEDFAKGSLIELPLPRTPYFIPGTTIVSRNYMSNIADGMFQHTEKKDIFTQGMQYATLGRLLDSDLIVKKYVERHPNSKRPSGAQRMLFILRAHFSRNRDLKIAREALSQYQIMLEDKHTAAAMFRALSRKLVAPQPTLFYLITAFMRSSFYNLFLLGILGSVKGELTPEVFADMATLLSNCEHVESADVPARLKALGKVIRKSRPDFSKLSVKEARNYLETDPGESGRLYRELVALHGHRCLKEIDLQAVTWGMNPEPLILTLQQVSAVDERSPQDMAAVGLNTILNPWRRLALRFLLPYAKRGVGDREAAKAMVVRGVHTMRLALTQLGQKMVDEGRLPEAHLLFQLEVDELRRLLDTRSPTLVLKAVRRQRMHSSLNKLRFPDFQHGVPAPITLENQVSGNSGGGICVYGTPVSRGKIEAPVRVVKYLEEAGSIRPGDILVTNATDIGWTPYFPLLAGIVTEIGGLLSHGAVIAREYGLPCVVGVEGATDIFTSGETLILDATRGTVESVKRTRS